MYGDQDVFSETNKVLNPLNVYGKTKLMGEEKVKEFCSNYIIVRTNIFGWNVKRDKISFAEWLYYSLKIKNKLLFLMILYFHPYTQSI